MSDTIEEEGRSFYEKNGGRVEEGSSKGALVVESVNKIMRSLKRTVYTNNDYCVCPGCFAVDCSYYLKQVLKSLPGIYYEVLPKSSTSGKTALAKDYYQFFADLPEEAKTGDYWQKIEDIKDVKPGDIIAFKYCDKKSTTGHVMVAYSPSQRSGCDDKDQYWVWVSDSANSGHFDDTRNGKGKYAKDFEYIAYNGSGGKPSGVGIGKMWFNTSNSPPYYRWSHCNKPKDPLKDNPRIKISIGRPI